MPDVAISRYDVCFCAAVRWMVPGDSHGPYGPRNDRKNESYTDYRVIARSVAERSGFFNNNDCQGQSYLD